MEGSKRMSFEDALWPPHVTHILKERYTIHYSMKCSFMYIHGQTGFQIHGMVLNYRETDLVKEIHSVPSGATVLTFTFPHQNLL